MNNLLKNDKKIAIILSSAILVLLVVGLSLLLIFKNGWHDSKKGVFYRSSFKKVTGLASIEGKQYLFANDGYLLEGFVKYHDNIYYSTKSGIAKGAFKASDGNEYFFDEKTGVFKSGRYTENGREYLRDDYGFLHTGLVKTDDGSFYVNKDGSLASGLVTDDAGFRYFDRASYKMVTGVKTIDEKDYYFGQDGLMMFGHIIDNNKTYNADAKTGELSYGWKVLEEGNKYYFYEDGSYIKDGVGQVDDKKFYFVDNCLQLGWIRGDDYYYCTENGLATGDYKLDGKVLCFADDGKLIRGWRVENGVKKYYNEQGVLQKGWQTIDNKKYFLKDDGAIATGEMTISGVKYLFTEEGVLREGWVESEKDGKQYFINGYFYTGLLRNQDGAFYLNEKGNPEGGLKTIAGRDYYFNESGVMQTGWIMINDKQYYFTQGGKATSNMKIDDKYYAFDQNGLLLPAGWNTTYKGKSYIYNDGSYAIGFVTIDGKKYHFNQGGYMTTGFFTDNDVYYFYNSAGNPTNTGWVTVGNNKYYIQEEGKVAVGLTKIGNDTYFFDKTGIMKTGYQKAGGVGHYFDNSGKMLYNTTVGNYVIDKDGVAKDRFTKITNDNLDDYLESVIARVVKSKDTEVKDIYNFVISLGIYYQLNDKKSERECAIRAFNTRKGACWDFSAVTRLLYEKAGFEAITILGKGHYANEHNWVIVNLEKDKTKPAKWRHFDPLQGVYCKTEAELSAQYKFNYSTGRDDYYRWDKSKYPRAV